MVLLVPYIDTGQRSLFDLSPSRHRQPGPVALSIAEGTTRQVSAFSCKDHQSELVGPAS